MSFKIRYLKLKKTDFFKFFNLHEIQTPKSSSSCIILEPGGFQEYIEIEIHFNEDEEINEAILFLDRKWIGDSESLNPFAKDITKSFIDTLIPHTEDNEFRESLITSIWNKRGNKDIVFCIDKVIQEWEKSTIEVKRFLDVYQNSTKEARKKLNDIEIIMKNKIQNDKYQLIISIKSFKDGLN